MCVQDIKKSGGVAAITAQVAKIKAEAEKLEVMDKAAGILAELLYTDQLLTEIKEYRPIMLRVRTHFPMLGTYKLHDSTSSLLWTIPKLRSIYSLVSRSLWRPTAASFSPRLLTSSKCSMTATSWRKR